jgi:hypothetical protein
MKPRVFRASAAKTMQGLDLGASDQMVGQSQTGHCGGTVVQDSAQVDSSRPGGHWLFPCHSFTGDEGSCLSGQIGEQGCDVLLLVVGNRVVGALVVDRRQPRLLDELEVRLLRLMVNQAALAIEKAGLHYEEVEEQILEKVLEVAQPRS